MNLKNKNRIIRIIESYLMTFALMNVCGRRTTDVFTLLFFVVAYALLGKKVKAERKTDSVLSGVTAGLFTTFYVLGNYAELDGGLTNKLFLLFYMGCTITGLLCLFYEGILFVLVNSSKVTLFEEAKPYPVKGFLITGGVIFLCMVPFLLTNFPGIMTPDSLSQYGQAVGIREFSDHHPWMHTMLISLFYHIGFAITGNVYAGIAFYTVAQMLLTALSIAYAWSALYEMGLKKKYCLIGILLFVLYPYNLIYSVTMWKDILFSMAVLVLTVTLFRLHYWNCAGKTWGKMYRDWILYVVSGFFVCMLRHNGFYGFLATAVVLVFLMKKQWKLFVPLTVGIVAVCFLIKGPVMTAANVEPGQFAFKLCIPLQQVAKVVSEGCPLSVEETELLEKINDLDYVRENYEKHGSDPMTAWVTYGNQSYLEEHKMEYLKLWISIGLRYPGKYIEAFVDQTKGYWYPMDPGQVVFFGITPNEYGVESRPILDGPAVMKFHELLTKVYTIFPIYGLLYSMGGMFWLFVMLMAIAIRNQNHSVWIAGVPLLFITLTLFIAVPLVADLRYDYQLLITVPVLAALAFQKQNERNETVSSK